MKQILFALLSMTLMAGQAAADAANDAAYDNFGGAVVDSQGDCVRTKWDGRNDPCAPPPPPPAPKPIVRAPAPKPAPLPVVALEQRTVYFDFDSAKLTQAAQNKLNQLIAVVERSSRITGLSVHGYTDQFGSDDYNSVLAAKRAGSVKSYLNANSRISSTVGEVRGFGKAAPEAECQGVKKRKARIACMASQRRVEVELKVQK